MFHDVESDSVFRWENIQSKNQQWHNQRKASKDTSNIKQRTVKAVNNCFPETVKLKQTKAKTLKPDMLLKAVQIVTLSNFWNNLEYFSTGKHINALSDKCIFKMKFMFGSAAIKAFIIIHLYY